MFLKYKTLSHLHMYKVMSRVSTGSGKHEMAEKIPCMEKSWDLKINEKSWKNHGILG